MRNFISLLAVALVASAVSGQYEEPRKIAFTAAQTSDAVSYRFVQDRVKEGKDCVVYVNAPVPAADRSPDSFRCDDFPGESKGVFRVYLIGGMVLYERMVSPTKEVVVQPSAVSVPQAVFYSQTVVPPGMHAHRTETGEVIIHGDENRGSAAAHAGITYPWYKIATAGQTVSCPNGQCPTASTQTVRRTYTYNRR